MHFIDQLLVVIISGGSRISHGRGCGPLVRALFGENVCENEKIGSCRWGMCWARPLDPLRMIPAEWESTTFCDKQGYETPCIKSSSTANVTKNLSNKYQKHINMFFVALLLQTFNLIQFSYAIWRYSYRKHPNN